MSHAYVKARGQHWMDVEENGAGTSAGRRVERMEHTSTWQRSKQDLCLNNIPHYYFIYCTSHMQTVL